MPQRTSQQSLHHWQEIHWKTTARVGGNSQRNDTKKFWGLNGTIQVWRQREVLTRIWRPQRFECPVPVIGQLYKKLGGGRGWRGRWRGEGEGWEKESFIHIWEGRTGLLWCRMQTARKPGAKLKRETLGLARVGNHIEERMFLDHKLLVLLCFAWRQCFLMGILSLPQALNPLPRLASAVTAAVHHIFPTSWIWWKHTSDSPKRHPSVATVPSILCAV